MSSQFKSLAIEEEKNRKKQIKKDLLERNKVEIERIAATIEIQVCIENCKQQIFEYTLCYICYHLLIWIFSKICIYNSYFKDLLKCMSTAKSKADFTSGENGAIPKLTKDQLGCLDDFGRLVRPSRRQYESADEFEKALAASAEHISGLIEGKSKKVGKSTYKELKVTLDGIKASGYFEGKSVKLNAEVSDGTDETIIESSKKDASDLITAAKETNRKKVSQNGSEQEKRDGGRRDKKRGNTRDERLNEKSALDTKGNDQSKQRQQYESKNMVPQNHTEHHSQTLQQQNDVYQSVPSQQTNLVTESSHQAMSMTTDPSQQYHQAPQVPQQMTVPVAPTAPGINFLQESQIDMGSPQMDPAVVVVHHTAPPTQGQSALPLGTQQPTNIATTVQNQVCHECHKNFET